MGLGQAAGAQVDFLAPLPPAERTGGLGLPGSSGPIQNFQFFGEIRQSSVLGKCAEFILCVLMFDFAHLACHASWIEDRKRYPITLT